MSLGLLVLRVVVGLLFMGHGAQKLFGTFGGHGLDGTGGFFESLGLRPGRRHALAAGTAEFAGGILLAFGLFTPFAALLITAVMVTAIVMVHGPKGPWSTNGGYEYNLVLIAAVFALAAVGAGTASLDHAFGIRDWGAGWAVGQLMLGALGGVCAVALGRSTRQGAPRGPAHPTAV